MPVPHSPLPQVLWVPGLHLLAWIASMYMGQWHLFLFIYFLIYLFFFSLRTFSCPWSLYTKYTDNPLHDQEQWVYNYPGSLPFRVLPPGELPVG